MTDNIDTSNNTQQSISSRVNSGIKNGVIEIYEDLLKTVWAKITPTLGTVTVATIMQRAINRTAGHHPALGYLTVDETGFVFDEIKAKINEEDKDELTNGFKELIANVFDILAKLTGNILVQQLMKEVEGIDVP